jgi:ubiquinone/menaquinone biosynthesis C-methylase UbiE
MTRELCTRLEPGTSIVATDRNTPMLDMARKLGTTSPVEWRPADGMDLPVKIQGHVIFVEA